MIDKLRKKLTWIFTISIMLLFTAAFCIIIKKDIAHSLNSEYEYFRITTENILFHFDTDHIENFHFAFFEDAEPIAFELEDKNGKTIYKTDSAAFQGFTDILAVLKSETKKESDISLIADSKISRSGIFSFPFEKRNYIGSSFCFMESDTESYTLYIVKQDTSFTDFMQTNFKTYLFIWLFMFVFTIIISYILIKKASEPTEKAIQSQKNFIASASHELKAPLAVILANSEVIAATPQLDNQLLQHLHTIDSEIFRMSNLVQDLLLLSSIDANTWSLNKSNIDICTLMLHIYERFEPLCQKNDMNLELSLIDDIFPEFTADENRLEQILGIFLDNAIYYGHAGTSINLTVHSESKWIVFSIQDHGIGIKDKDKPFIFDRFYQVDQSHTNTHHYGLGLSIAKELVEMHKGKIELLDTQGGGCTFKIFFPVAK